tara:strand:+ start:2989 stop:3177 length:189 start_codon:yes stop_codon:yes gene_type:complete
MDQKHILLKGDHIYQKNLKRKKITDMLKKMKEDRFDPEFKKIKKQIKNLSDLIVIKLKLKSL